MNELNPEVVIEALEHCASGRSKAACEGCPLEASCEYCEGSYELVVGALALLREKDATIEGLIRHGHATLREKDAEIERYDVPKRK